MCGRDVFSVYSMGVTQCFPIPLGKGSTYLYNDFTGYLHTKYRFRKGVVTAFLKYASNL